MIAGFTVWVKAVINNPSFVLWSYFFWIRKPDDTRKSLQIVCHVSLKRDEKI